MNKSSKFTEQQGKILTSALLKAPKTGWNDDLLTELKEEFGIVEMTRYCPRGLDDLSRMFADWADNEMLRAMEQDDVSQMKVRDKITHGVRARLMALSPHRQAFKASMKYMLHPMRGLFTKKLTWQTADRLWYAAGDRATDYNHYTKRLLLSGVLASTTLYWLRDTSDDYSKTWVFLDRRIQNVMTVGGYMAKIKQRFE